MVLTFARLCEQGVFMFKKFIFILFAVACIAAIVFSVLGILKIQMPVVSGVWKAVDDEFYIEFDEAASTYIDSVYGVPRPYELRGTTLILTELLGTESVTHITKNYGARVSIALNGKSYLMEATERAMPSVFWSVDFKEECVGVYKFKVGYDRVASLRLYEDFVCTLGDSSEPEIFKYIFSDAGELALFDSSGEIYQVLQPWVRGFIFGPMDGILEITNLKANAIEERGVLLSGGVLSENTGVSYEFREDNTVTRSTLGGESVEFTYFADNTGLISLVDMTGATVHDYLYVDTSTGRVYRYVLERDDWFDFLEKAGGLT